MTCQICGTETFDEIETQDGPFAVVVHTCPKCGETTTEVVDTREKEPTR